MPRERGKPKRGPSWYCYVARQRQRHLRKLAQASLTTLIRGNKEPNSPPMAYVEEKIPEEPITIPPDSLLYTVSNHQHWPSTNLPVTATAAVMEGATCLAQEKFLGMTAQLRLLHPPQPWPESHTHRFVALEHLELIFEMQRDMMEQLHRHTLLSSRLDIMFDAF